MKFLNSIPACILILYFIPIGDIFAQQPAKSQAPVYLVTEVKPQFPGENEVIQRYFSKKINTKNAEKREIVTVSLIVTAKGQVRNAVVGKGISPEIDSLVVKEARKMEKWQPGKIKGQPVDTRVLFPVIFVPANSASDETKTVPGKESDGKQRKMQGK